MKRLILSIFLALTIAIPYSHAKLNAINGKVKDGYNFWLYEPETKHEPELNATIDSTAINDSTGLIIDTISHKKPLVIFLHGRSLCGNNLNKVLRYGTIAAVKGGRKIDAYIVAPQNPGSFWKPEKIMNVVDWVSERHPIDSTRIYVLGMSLGGYGTIDLVATYPHRIAAAMALCGGGSRKDLSGLNEVPLWIIHGTADRAVSVNESRKVKNKMKEAGETPLLRYDEWTGVNHGALARLFYLDKTYQWLFKHTLNNRTVDKSITITQSDTKNAYKGFKHRSSSKNKSKAKKKSKRSTKKK